VDGWLNGETRHGDGPKKKGPHQSRESIAVCEIEGEKKGSGIQKEKGKLSGKKKGGGKDTLKGKVNTRRRLEQ